MPETSTYAFLPWVQGKPNYAVTRCPDPTGHQHHTDEHIGSVYLDDLNRWRARFGTALDLDLGPLEDREAAAARLDELQSRRRERKLFKELGSPEPTVTEVAAFLLSLPPHATFTYGECGSHEITIEWVAENRDQVSVPFKTPLDPELVRRVFPTVPHPFVPAPGEGAGR